MAWHRYPVTITMSVGLTPLFCHHHNVCIDGAIPKVELSPPQWLCITVSRWVIHFKSDLWKQAFFFSPVCTQTKVCSYSGIWGSKFGSCSVQWSVQHTWSVQQTWSVQWSVQQTWSVQQGGGGVKVWSFVHVDVSPHLLCSSCLQWKARQNIWVLKASERATSSGKKKKKKKTDQKTRCNDFSPIKSRVSKDIQNAGMRTQQWKVGAVCINPFFAREFALRVLVPLANGLKETVSDPATLGLSCSTWRCTQR